jgi:hypothetical protein
MFAIIPPLARIQDRVPLPFSKSGALVPVSYWTAIFGRNYIKSEGRDKLETIAAAFEKKYPQLKVKYMDCNYPFRFNVKGDENTWILEGLFPHFTHDGAKADIALVYNDEQENASNLINGNIDASLDRHDSNISNICKRIIFTLHPFIGVPKINMKLL